MFVVELKTYTHITIQNGSGSSHFRKTGTFHPADNEDTEADRHTKCSSIMKAGTQVSLQERERISHS